MVDTIVLPLNATADPEKCGSCKFFKRTDDTYASVYRSEGWCRIIMPPNAERYATACKDKSDDDQWGPRHVKDTDGCDLWKTTGARYVVSKEVGPHGKG